MIEISDRTARRISDAFTALVGVSAGVLAALANDPANIITLLVIAALAVSSLFTSGDESNDEQQSPTNEGG